MARLIDTTESFLRRNRRMGMYDNERAHAIYTTADGKDYCREDSPPGATPNTHEDAVRGAREHFDRVADENARKYVTGFRIEWW